jgi:hypothetical protein
MKRRGLFYTAQRFVAGLPVEGVKGHILPDNKEKRGVMGRCISCFIGAGLVVIYQFIFNILYKITKCILDSKLSLPRAWKKENRYRTVP